MEIITKEKQLISALKLTKDNSLVEIEEAILNIPSFKFEDNLIRKLIIENKYNSYVDLSQHLYKYLQNN